MKIKILPMLVIISLFLTGINVIAIENKVENNIIQIAQENDHSLFSNAKIKQKGDYFEVNVEEANTVLRATGKPIVPCNTKIYTYPRGTKIKDVKCTISEVKTTTQVITGKIQPAPEPVKRVSIKNNGEIADNIEKIKEDKNVYSSSELYPENWYDYKIYSGLVDGVPSVILKVNTYPVRYSPNDNTLYSVDRFDIQVTYEKPINKKTLDPDYDLLIISPKKFVSTLQPLITHKKSLGYSTTIKTTEDIYNEYTGRDKPEQIKQFIKYAEQNWGIKYVLLVGGLNNHFLADDREHINYGAKWWHVPVRYTNINTGYISDLYYADLYKGEGEFEDWDSNGNGLFAEQFEELDLWPDVYYGRLPCRNNIEVFFMVNKIINYEKSSHRNEDWFKRMIVVGGITFEFLSGPEYDGEEPDGEWLCNLSLDYMKYHINDPVKVYSSNTASTGPRPDYINISNEFSKGAGFALLQGHGNAYLWDTKWPDSEGKMRWVGGIRTMDYPLIKNGGKLPVVVVGGCHNGIFNVSFINTLLDSDWSTSKYHAYGAPVASCFSWQLVAKFSGGAIACTGCTDYGVGWMGDPLNLSAMLESNFFYKVGIDNVTTLGEAHSGSIEKYMTDVNVHENSAHYYSITEYQLFGDPTLIIGGNPKTVSKDI
jgi:hypothetical protein